MGKLYEASHHVELSLSSHRRWSSPLIVAIRITIMVDYGNASVAYYTYSRYVLIN